MKAIRALFLILPGFLLLLSLAAQQPGVGIVGWYSGEWQSGVPGLANWYVDSENHSRVYDEFQVPESGWTVTGVFSDNVLNQFPSVMQASWEIRRAMAPGNGGTLIASGIASAMQLSDPSVIPARYPPSEAAKHFRIQVTGLQVHLPSGRYWLSVAPVGQGQSYLSATLGAHAIAAPTARSPLALFHCAGSHCPNDSSFVPAESVASGGQLGRAKHFAQGILIAN